MGRDRILKQYLRDRFLITTTTGETWSALLVSIDDNTLLLAEVRAVGRDGTETPADGRIFLPRVDVKYMQLT